MKAVVICEPGGPEKLIYTEVKAPEPKAGWSLVKIMGCGVNHSEVFTRQGLSPSVRFPRILGIECVGIIESTAAPQLKKGQKIVSVMGGLGRDFDGGYAEYALIPDEQIYPIETDLPWETVAAIPETYYTAFGSMRNLRITDTDSVLVRAASSGVGVAFARLLRAKYPDMKIDGSCRSDKKRGQLLNCGFSGIIEDIDGVLQTDNRYDKILELVGPATEKDSLSHLNEGGIVCSTGQLGGKWYLDGFDPIIDIPDGCYLTSFHSNEVSAQKMRELFEYIEKYHVDAAPEKVFPLKDARKAHEYLASSRSFGKAVLMNV